MRTRAPKSKEAGATGPAKRRGREAGTNARDATERVDPAQRALLHARLPAWYAEVRRDLPWRRTRDPYAIWLSEVMLQQTRVETVMPYYARFLERYPTVHALADAPLDDVLTMWSGLGYYRRARMLHAAARQVATDHAGAFPSTAEGLASIKGIGPYTAGAVASIAFGEAAPLVDGNVVRVLARLFAIEEDVRGGAGLARIWRLAGALVDARDPGSWNQALMELGATVCVPRAPRCLVCPVRDACAAKARGLEATLPSLKAKAKPRLQERWAFVIRVGERDVLLARRREGERFGGMWEPPSVDRWAGESLATASARLEEALGVTIRGALHAGAVTHVLSHRRLEIDVVVARSASPAPVALGRESGEYDRIERVPLAELAEARPARALSTLARKLLAQAERCDPPA